MAQHNSLGHTCGAGGKKNHRHGIRIHFRIQVRRISGFQKILSLFQENPPFVDGAGFAFPFMLILILVNAGGCRCNGGVGAIAVEIHHYQIFYLVQILQLGAFILRAEDGGTIGGPHQVADLSAGKLFVDGNDDPYAVHHRQVGDDPLVATLTHYGDPLILQSHLQHFGAQGVHVVLQQAVFHGFVGSTLLFFYPEGRIVAVQFRTSPQKILKGGNLPNICIPVMVEISFHDVLLSINIIYHSIITPFGEIIHIYSRRISGSFPEHLSIPDRKDSGAILPPVPSLRPVPHCPGPRSWLSGLLPSDLPLSASSRFPGTGEPWRCWS